MVATPGDVDTLPSDLDGDGAATPEANKPVQSQKRIALSDLRTVVLAVRTMMMMLSDVIAPYIDLLVYVEAAAVVVRAFRGRLC